MANHTFIHAQTFQQAMPLNTQTLQAGPGEENAYNIWANIQRHPLYLEYRDQLHACIPVHDTAFSHYSALLMDPLASRFIETVSLSIKLVPPIDMWNDIVKLRCHQNFPSVRSIILADIEKQNLNQWRNPSSARSSDASYQSLAHLSMQSGHSSSSSRTSNTDSCVPFDIDESVESHSKPPAFAKGNIHFPDPPSLVTSARGQRRAPEGKCFVCPSKECKGKPNSFFKRVGDWTNHIEKAHKVSPWHDPSRFLRNDPRPRAAQQVVESAATHEAAAVLQSEINTDIKLAANPTNDHVKQEPQSATAKADYLEQRHKVHTPVKTMMPPAGHYGNTGIETLFEDIFYQQSSGDQGLSWFDHEDSMQN